MRVRAVFPAHIRQVHEAVIDIPEDASYDEIQQILKEYRDTHPNMEFYEDEHYWETPYFLPENEHYWKTPYFLPENDNA